ncbi:hypothetical protein [Candidatus Cloacimonas acidaminovorans]|uniref:hypothetical protein n=1 Tax=Candidatus Cloacimonas acidaminovorans TaxID=456827 RepID=UPI0012FF2DAE|nr:hypothetical protein [Candidatus Cloacimonas acidaminovorans]
MKNEEGKSVSEAVRIGQRYFQREGKLDFCLFLNQFPSSTQPLGWVVGREQVKICSERNKWSDKTKQQN